MGLIVTGISEVKFYNAKTGEEIQPMDLEGLKINKQKEEELDRLRKQTGYHFPELCPNCGEYY